MERVSKYFHPFPILLVAAAIVSIPSLFSQPQINAYHGVTQNPLDSISGESDPRFDLLRYENLNFSIKDVARMSREDAFRILLEYLHPTEPVEQDLLSEAAQLKNPYDRYDCDQFSFEHRSYLHPAASNGQQF